MDYSVSIARQPSAAMQLALYRIVQESLTNVLRHAQATRAHVELAQDDAGIRLAISDNGAGAAAARSDAGNGILGMTERAELLGGTLTAGNRRDGGFQVTVLLPEVP
ncbi:hypothetical protein D9V29_00090 [Mycetocola manganoxydans]|uniref:histidine kinase n=1 Tax=Mycetocola manganoxydans TaxID=699879 RepID=A0A3L7A162_9MICO|nr:ATP-binding protein [Mycetocola manganoxydans]RLP73740.1 hypothetical protein D9V29_00090 [Mycetocola manganoxydans]GHD43297.1 hypothetical protein GCM10008097_10160 [Mycetocola manganoxydans]